MGTRRSRAPGRHPGARRAHEAGERLGRAGVGASAFVEISALDRAGYRRAMAAEAELLGWRPAAVTAGLAVTAFGILILAMRKPEKRAAKNKDP